MFGCTDNLEVWVCVKHCSKSSTSHDDIPSLELWLLDVRICVISCDDQFANSNITAPLFQELHEKNVFHHEYYFISQIFDDQWTLPTATIASVQK